MSMKEMNGKGVTSVLKIVGGLIFLNGCVNGMDIKINLVDVNIISLYLKL